MPRTPGVCLLALGLGVTAGAQDGGPSNDRSRLVAALERLMTTGNPRHISHDEGAWLQESVDDAIRAGDSEIVQLAMRAAVPLLVGVSRPVSTIDFAPYLYVQTPSVLRLPYPVRYKAEIFASIDGGETFLAGTAPLSSGSGVPLPEYARQPGIHYVRLQARFVYELSGGLKLSDETRELPDVVYAVYDPRTPMAYDARLFVLSPLWATARQVHAALPDAPFPIWLNGAVTKREAASDPSREWTSAYCDERIVEQGLLPRTRELCAVWHFAAEGTLGQIWIRTGRIELDASGVRWLAESPSFQALVLHSMEFEDLSQLPNLLATDRSTWPRGDALAMPEDIVIAPSRARPGWMNVTATIRNAGDGNLRGVQVDIDAASGALKALRTASFVVDIPRRGSIDVTAELPLPAPYGVVAVSAFQMSNHMPHDLWTPDPTPHDAHAFRIVNPRAAPSDFSARIRREFGSDLLRGYE